MKNKKTIILSIIAVITLLTLIIGATYAYFQASGGTGTNTDVKVTTYTTDVFNFEVGNDRSIYADQTTFAIGKGNASASTFAKAILTANNKTNTSTMNYYLYLNVSKNSFGYTQNTNTPELLLTITDASGNAVTDITSLTYKTVTDGKGASISGYDITSKSGLITLFDNKAITASPTKTDQWNIAVTLVNYNADQSNNMGKEFNAELIIQKESIIHLTSQVCSNGTNLATCLTTLYSNGKSEYTNIYYHNSSLANGAGDNSYRYSGPSDSVNNFVCFGSDAETCPIDNLYRIIGVIDGKVKLIKYDFATSALLGTDGDYGGSSTPKKSLYKGNLSSITTYRWNYNNNVNLGFGSNTWSTSLLNTTNLNTNFINNIGSAWTNKIATTTWKVGGNTYDNLAKSIPSIAFQNEIVNSVTTNTTDNAKEYDAKIGLMYVSDYYYSASPSAWTLVGYNSSDSTKDYRVATSINWMYIGKEELTITRLSNQNFSVSCISDSGFTEICWGSRPDCIRPVFNLMPTVTYVGGSGTQSDPIRIN